MFNRRPTGDPTISYESTNLAADIINAFNRGDYAAARGHMMGMAAAEPRDLVMALAEIAIQADNAQLFFKWLANAWTRDLDGEAWDRQNERAMS